MNNGMRAWLNRNPRSTWTPYRSGHSQQSAMRLGSRVYVAREMKVTDRTMAEEERVMVT